MKLKDLKAGDVVEVDGGFDCMKAGEHTVHSHKGNSDYGRLYLPCLSGLHFLDGQENFDEENGDLVGVKWPGDDWPQQERKR